MKTAIVKRAILPLLCLIVASCSAAPPRALPDASPKAAARDAEPAAQVTKPPAPPPPLAKPVRTQLTLDGVPRQGGIVLARVPTGTSSLRLDGNELPITDDGYVLLGFNRDAAPDAMLSWTVNDMEQTRSLSVVPGTWRLERVNLSLPRGRKATERRASELAQIRAARTQSHQSDGWRQDFIWPVDYRNIPGGRLSGFFGAQRIYRGTPGGYHTGLDIAAPTGTPFVAPADGVVTLATAQPFSREGYLLMVDHGMGLNSAFVHCSQIVVKAGDRIKQGQMIGRVGATGSATGAHLHWSMMWNASRVDPLLMLPDN